MFSHLRLLSAKNLQNTSLRTHKKHNRLLGFKI
jgi:hypothetical protein